MGPGLNPVLTNLQCRHWQKVQRKRRLERELLHQYSYPNSEADEDVDYQSLPEVESVVNNQFVAFTDHSDKTLLEEIPEVCIKKGLTTCTVS